MDHAVQELVRVAQTLPSGELDALLQHPAAFARLARRLWLRDARANEDAVLAAHARLIEEHLFQARTTSVWKRPALSFDALIDLGNYARVMPLVRKRGFAGLPEAAADKIEVVEGKALVRRGNQIDPDDVRFGLETKFGLKDPVPAFSLEELAADHSLGMGDQPVVAVVGDHDIILAEDCRDDRKQRVLHLVGRQAFPVQTRFMGLRAA